MTETIYICETCRDEVEPGARGIVEAHEMKFVGTMGQPDEWLEGLKVYFHQDCYPYGLPNYKLVE